MSKKKHTPYYPPPPLPRTGVESHAHLNSRQFSMDLEDVITRAANAGVAQIIQVFLSPEAWATGKGLFDTHPNIFFILGIHPTEAMDFGPEVVQGMRIAIDADARIRAIGEIGLDYYWKDCPPEIQKLALVTQLQLARELDLPVVIHCRDAEDDTLALLENEGCINTPLLWHCFGGNTTMAKRIINNGWHISIPGPATFPANQDLRDAVAAIPEDRLLVETDCPYLSPIPLRGKRNEPANLGYTIEAMAKARGVPVEELWTRCGDNARCFFRLPELAL